MPTYNGNNIGTHGNHLSRRSPSILVTDSRSTKKRPSAPFAGHAASIKKDKSGNITIATNVLLNSNYTKTKKSISFGRYSSGTEIMPRSRPQSSNRHNSKFSEISMDSILSEMSAVPSGRREERLSQSSYDRYDLMPTIHHNKMINPLRPRTSKTSERLVLIPDENDKKYAGQIAGKKRTISSKFYLEKNSRELNENELPRITAYNVSDGFNLQLASKFFKKTHDVSPRLYDECLYLPYCLPLLPGKDGFRIKSNLSKTTIGGKTLMDRLIDTSEQRDHHYEYYSGVETVEDINNNFEIDEIGLIKERNIITTPSLLPNLGNNTQLFDPSEPQYFAEETTIEQEQLESGGAGQLVVSSKLKNKCQLNTSDQQHAEIFIFNYGVIVFWNFTEIQEKNILGDIAFSDHKNMVIRPIDEQDIEIEQFHFEYDMDTDRPRIFNDIITLRSGDHIIKLTLSHAIAQSSKLSRFESRISPILGTISKLPKRLALYGSLGMKREQLLKKSGKLFKLRVDVNLSSSILDTPEFFWSFEPSLHPLYTAMREYLEIDPRVQVLNDRCKVFLEFFDICVDSIAERNMARITSWFIFVIFISVLVSVAEILVRYYIINTNIK